jgi:hypothetical protein
MEGWMQFHLGHLARGFRQEGVDCEIVNYRTSQLGALRRRVLGDSSEEVLGRRRTDALIGAARDYRADIVLTYRERFDFERLCSGTGTEWRVRQRTRIFPRSMGSIWF